MFNIIAYIRFQGTMDILRFPDTIWFRFFLFKDTGSGYLVGLSCGRILIVPKEGTDPHPMISFLFGPLLRTLSFENGLCYT